MISAIFNACCALAPEMDGWKHLEKSDGHHVWWCRTTNGFALGVFVDEIKGHPPLFTWKCKREVTDNEVSGSASSVYGGTTLAVECEEKWALELKHRDTPSRRRPDRLLPAGDESIPF